MKQKHHLLALTLAGVMVAPTVALADSSLYGSVRLSLKGVDAGDDMVLDLVNNASRLGYKGSVELDNGLTAVGHYEIGVNADKGVFGGGTATNRLSYAGVKGGFGEIYAGSQWSPYFSMVGGTTDKFNSVGANHIRKVFRIADTIQYKNTFGPVALGASISADGAAGETGIDRTQVAAKIKLGAVAIGLGIENLSQADGNDVVDGTTTGIAATYKENGIHLAAALQMVEAAVEGSAADQDKLEVYGGYSFGSKKVGFSYGQTDTGAESTPSTIAFGFQNQVAKQLKYWLEGQVANADSDTVEDTTTVSFGMRYDW